MFDIAQTKSWNKDQYLEEMQHEYDAMVTHGMNLLLLSKGFMNDEMLTRQEVADIIRCTPQAIPHDLPSYKIGHKASLFSKAEVFEYIRAHREV